MHTTSTRLADGRELIYVDDEPGRDRTAVDTRPPAPVATTSQLRFDPLLGEWVVIAAHRQDRTHLPAAERCPLCPSTPERPTEIPASDYDVVVFENRFPSLAGPDPHGRVMEEPPVADGPPVASPHGGHAPGEEPGEDPALQHRPGAGRCEVVCFTSDHDACLASLPARRVRTVIDALAERTESLSRRRDVAQVFCFENRGEEIGVTLHHPHGQIYGYPFVTPRTATMLARAVEHERATGRGLLADVLAAERRAARRVVLAGEHWTAYVPAAARWPFEVHLVAHRRVPDLPALGEAERAELAVLWPDLLARLDRVLGVPMPYVAAWHQAPVDEGRDVAHLHLQVFSIRRALDKLKFLAGSEAAMGVFINDVAPERAADLLRTA